MMELKPDSELKLGAWEEGRRQVGDYTLEVKFNGQWYVDDLEGYTLAHGKEADVETAKLSATKALRERLTQMLKGL